MKSFLLQEFSRLILPLALLLGLALLLKGHDAPGGGFVAGLSFSVAGILGFTAYGVRRFHAAMAVEPERVALLGGLLLIASLAAPLLLGDPGLTHRHGAIEFGPIAWKWHTTLVFEIGVVMTIGGALSAAALWLWETPLRTEEDD
jgi:multisubunit Na+/H+ antiporter MnhB subunit